MSSKITIEILRTVAGIGKQWEIKEVSSTYAENKLFPEKIARLYVATENIDEKRTKILAKRFDITKRLHEKKFIHHAHHEGGHLTETINPEWIMKKIRSDFHISLLPEMIRLDEKHIKKAGSYRIHIDLWSDAYAQITLEIH